MPENFSVKYGQYIEVLYADVPLSKYSSGYHFGGTVIGKLKGIDAWVVEISSIDVRYTNARIPNRHLELEWGHFGGRERETVVLLEEIKGVIS